MKAERTHDYRITDYGKVSFIKRDAGSGHAVWRVIWTKDGLSQGTTIGWLQPEQRPCADLAVFYCKVACAEQDGLDRYHYHDKHIDPPKRTDARLFSLRA